MWVAIKVISVVILTQLIYLVRICQGTMKRGEKVWTTAIESVSNQIFLLPFSWENSIANIAPLSSTMRELVTPRKVEKAPKNLPSKSLTIPLTIPPHTEYPHTHNKSFFIHLLITFTLPTTPWFTNHKILLVFFFFFLFSIISSCHYPSLLKFL